MSYTSTNGMFTYTITNNTNYVIEQLDYDIILSSMNRWESLVTIDTRFPSSQTITISFIIDALGINILGGASITNSANVGSYIYGNVIPSTANITMNNTYLYGLKTTIRNDGFSSYYHVLLHEIGHILGIGSFWYLTGCPKTSYDDNGTTKYYYTGTNAFREYKSHFAGFSNDAFLGIPIEDDGGAGTAGVHPEEGSEGGISADNRYINGIFHPGLDTELMTGWLDSSPVSTPLSRITLGFLEDMGYTVNYNLADVYIMSWPSTTDANNLEQTFIQGFLDVSGGNMINRNGNLSVLDGTMDVSGDVTFDSKLSVGGDVSFNGTTIDICGNLYAQYPNNSIPAAAINGQVEATPNFAGDVAFQSNVTIATKAAIGSTTLPTGSTALKVTGDLDFTGILKKDGVEYVSGATSLNGLSDVKAGGTNFANGLLIGTTTTGTLNVANNNIGVGKNVLYSLTSGDNNVGMGYMALNKVSTGSSNVCFGQGAARKVDTGQQNVAIGDYAGDVITTGNFNTFIGGASNADTGLTGLNNTTAIGYNAKVTANYQIMLGTASEMVVIPGSQLNVAGTIVATGATGHIDFGGKLRKDGTDFGRIDITKKNYSFGENSQYLSAISGTDNIGFGREANKKVNAGAKNVGIGTGALLDNESGDNNVGIGYQSLTNVTGDDNTAIGSSSGTINITGINNTYIGKGTDADTGLTGLNNSTAIGYNTKVTASNQIMLGTASESVVIPGKLDVVSDISFSGDLYQNGSLFVGGATSLDGLSDVKFNGTDFTNSLLIGTTPTGILDAAKDNTGVGYNVLTKLTTGDNNTGMGCNVLSNVTSGNRNTAVGHSSLNKHQTGEYNVAYGDSALHKNTTASQNTGIGFYALFNNTTGANNTAIGSNAGNKNTLNGNNTYLGYATDLDATDATWHTSTAIGYAAKITANNQIMLGRSTETVVAPGQVDICGNLYAKYDEVTPTIPAGAIIGGVGGGTEFPHITINPIDVTVDVPGIQALNEYLTFTIPHSMTALNYLCTAHPGMLGNFKIEDYSVTETDKTYYVRMAPDANTDGNIDDPYYIFSDTVNGTTLNGGVLNDQALTTNGGIQLTLYKGNTYTFISINTVGHPFIVGDSTDPNKTTGIKLESNGTGATTESSYREPYPLHVNGTANIEKNLNVAKKLTVSGPIIQW